MGCSPLGVSTNTRPELASREAQATVHIDPPSDPPMSAVSGYREHVGQETAARTRRRNIIPDMYEQKLYLMNAPHLNDLFDSYPDRVGQHVVHKCNLSVTEIFRDDFQHGLWFGNRHSSV